MWKIKNINYNNFLLIVFVFLFFSCQNEKCTSLKIKRPYSLISGIILNDTLIVTVDTLFMHTMIPYLIGFNLDGDSLFTRESNGMIAKQQGKLYSYALPYGEKIKIYDENLNLEKETAWRIKGFLSLYPKKVDREKYNELGIVLQGKTYLTFFQDYETGNYSAFTRDTVKEYNQTSFQGFAGDSHVYNDTLYVEDKCFCVAKVDR